MRGKELVFIRNVLVNSALAGCAAAATSADHLPVQRDTKICFHSNCVGHAGRSWHAARGGYMPSRVIDVNRHLVMMLALTTQFRTCLDEDVLDRARGPRRRSRRPGRTAARVVLSEHHAEPATSCCISTKAFENSSLPHNPGKLPRNGRQTRPGSQRSHKEF